MLLYDGPSIIVLPYLQTMLKRELARAKEVNLKLAAKLTKMEADMAR